MIFFAGRGEGEKGCTYEKEERGVRLARWDMDREFPCFHSFKFTIADNSW